MKTKKQGRRNINYKGVQLPEPLIDEVEKYIRENPEYRSRAEFIKEAIKSFLLSKHKGEGYPPAMIKEIADLVTEHLKKKDEE